MKKILLIFMIIFGLYLPCVVKAEELVLEWEKKFEGLSRFDSILELKDGNYIVTGANFSREGYISKINKNGDTLWEFNYGDFYRAGSISSIIETVDGDIISTGFEVPMSSSVSIFVKYDKDGKIIVDNKRNYVGYSDIDELLDNYIVVAEEFAENLDFDILSFDKSGNILWEKAYEGKFNSVSSHEHGFVVAGLLSQNNNNLNLISNGYNDALIVNYDKDGNVIWEKKWGGSSTEVFNSVVATKDGFVAVGEFSSKDIENLTIGEQTDAMIVRYDLDGNIIWQRSLGGNSVDSFYSVISVNDGFIVMGNTNSTDLEGITTNGKVVNFIIKYDKNGNIMWRNVDDMYVGHSGDNSIIFTNDNSLLVVDGLVNSVAFIKKYSFDYNIESKESENGTISVDRKDNLVYINTVPNEGYVVEKIIVKDINGDAVSVSESDDGIFSFELLGDVSIDVSFVRSFTIDKKEITNGKVDIVKLDNNIARVTPIPNEGYEFDKIVIKDKTGNVLDLDVTKLEDGTYSFPLNDDVSVEVLFKEIIENPKTGFNSVVDDVLTICIVFFIGLFVMNNYRKSYEL